MTDSDNDRLRLLAFLQGASKEANRNPRYGAMEIRDFFEKIIPLLGDMFDCKAQSKKQHRNSDTLSNLEEHIPKLVANDLHTIQRLGSYAAHEGQFHTEEYPLKKDSILHAAENGRRIVDLFFPASTSSKSIESPAQWATASIIKEMSGPFLTDVKEATHCSYCDASFGDPCVTKDGREVGKGLEHTVRKRAYELYRKTVRDGYGTTIINAMHEFTKGWNDEFLTPGDIYTWFSMKYPAFKRTSLQAHITMMTTNRYSRIHHSQHAKPYCQLFTEVPSHKFDNYVVPDALKRYTWLLRIYDENQDQSPIYIEDLPNHLSNQKNRLLAKLQRGEPLSTEELERLQRGE